MSGRIIPLVMCGGAGTRLWPASRELRPAQFLPLFGARSTFQDTSVRVSEPALFDRPIIVTNAAYRFMVLEQLAELGLEADVLLEPKRRNSGPAIAAGAAFAETSHQDLRPARSIFWARRKRCRRAPQQTAAPTSRHSSRAAADPTEPEWVVRRRRVLRLRGAITRLVETRKRLLGVAHPPFRGRTGRAADRATDRARGHTIRRHQQMALAHPVLRLRRTRQAFRLGALFLRQGNRCRFRDAAHAPLNHNSIFRNSGVLAKNGPVCRSQTIANCGATTRFQRVLAKIVITITITIPSVPQNFDPLCPPR